MALGEIRDFLDAHTPRLRSLEDRTRRESTPTADRSAAREALLELSLALEELRVSEEELRVQSDMLTGVQQALETERVRHQSFFAHFPDPCVVTDAAGVVNEANRAASELLRVRPDTLPASRSPCSCARRTAATSATVSCRGFRTARRRSGR